MQRLLPLGLKKRPLRYDAINMPLLKTDSVPGLHTNGVVPMRRYLITASILLAISSPYAFAKNHYSVTYGACVAKAEGRRHQDQP